MSRLWQWLVVRWDALLHRRYARCIGCGAMAEELRGECVLYGVMHSETSVDRYGRLKEQ
jgi:hypothetical protein